MYGTYIAEKNISKDDKYGFVNEIEVRIATGIAVTLGLYSFISILFFGSFTIPTFFLGLIWLDFMIKVFCDPKYSIFAAMVRPFIKKETWVGSLQKQFAWSLGLFLATFAFACVLIISGFLPSYGIGNMAYEMVNAMYTPAYFAVPLSPPLIACVLCIIFMTSESVFGYCVGCAMYRKLVKLGWMKAQPEQNCPNGVCEVK